MAQIKVRVQPRTSRNEIGPIDANGVLRLRVTSPPEDGKANAAIVKLLAKHLGIAPSAISIVRGQTSRNKTIEIDDLTDAEIRQRL